MSRQNLGEHTSRFGAAIAVSFALSALCCEGQWVTLGQNRAHAGAGGLTPTVASTARGSTMPDGGGSGATLTGASSGTGSTATSTGGGGQSTTATGGTGQAGPAEPQFTDVIRVKSLASDCEDDNPTLTSDLRELYFSSKNRPLGKGNVDVWVAKRGSATADFGEPMLVSEVSTEGIESSPAISANGLTLWIGFEPETGGLGGYDVMQATRATVDDAFGAPALIAELSSTKDDIPRPLGYHGLTMPLASRRGSDIYLTYFATRPSVGAPFGEPMLLANLVVEGANVADAFLTDDGLTLYFARAVDSISDLFVAFRSNVDSQFGTAIALSTINTPNDDRDPWLSSDGNTLFFSSDRDVPGTLNIYQATMVKP